MYYRLWIDLLIENCNGKVYLIIIHPDTAEFEKKAGVYMLYTVMPLERIYTDFRGREAEINKSGDNSEAEEEYQEVLLPHGRIVTRRNGKNYIIERINSTDMSDYLNEEYYPGKTVTKQK